jgi:hypothetical protein
MKGTDGKTIGAFTPPDSGFVFLDNNGVTQIRPGTVPGNNSVTTDNTINGDGDGSPLGVNLDLIASKAYADSVAAANGGTGADTAVKTIYFDPLYFKQTGNSQGDPISLLWPGGTGNVAIKENFGRLSVTTYTIGSGDVNLLFIGTANGTWTLPAFNSINHERVLYIRNNSSFMLNFDKSIWLNESTSTSQLSPGAQVKLLVDDTNDKIWVIYSAGL